VLHQMLEYGIGDALIGKAYVSGLEVRINQLDAAYLSDDKQLPHLLALHERTRAFSSADSLAIALIEDLRRRGDSSRAGRLYRCYLQERRELTPFSASLSAVMEHLSGDVVALERRELAG